MQAEVHTDPLAGGSAPDSQGEPGAWAAIRTALLDETGLVRALASGRRRGFEPPEYVRMELRYVDLKGSRHLQITEYDERQAHTRNVAGADLEKAVDELIDVPFGTFHVETTTET